MEDTLRVILPPPETPVTPDEVRQTRTTLGLTLTEFARVMGVDAFSAGRWESGQSQPQNPRLWRWAVKAVEAGIVEPGMELQATTRE